VTDLGRQMEVKKGFSVQVSGVRDSNVQY